ncbi:MAG: hypothetical protein HWE20_09640 [Gammaproteobacteria bacterium]|nr:hypothetical protein [Gammaproteobacteria bacterium]
MAAVLVIDSWSSLRPVGMFNSPTSLGVFSVAIYMLYGGVLKYLGGLIAILTGSRGVALILISLFSIRRLVVIIVGLVVVVSGLMLFSNDLVPRSFSVGGASDTGRLLSFDKVAELRFGFWDVLFGHGRQSFGSLGQWESGYAVVVESSVFTWFLSYGFGLMTPVFVLFFYGLYRQRSLVLSMLLFVGIVSVTLDALAVTLILYLAVYRRQRARYLNAYVVR